MLDTRSQDLLARVQVKGPKWVTVVLAVLIVLECARAAYTLISAPPVDSPQPTVRAAPLRADNGVNVQSVVAAHLFGQPPPEAAPDPANAPVSAANLMLAGTIATEDPKKGVAIISEGGGPSKVFSVGDNVGGAALHLVYLDHVILDRGGALETLNLPRQLTGVRAPVIARAADSRTAAAVDNIRRMVQQDPTLFDQVMRTVASYDSQAGKLRGFRAYPGRNRAIFGKLGLKPGDLVTAINGTTLDDPQRSQEVFNTIQSSDHVTVTVERNGQKQDITLNIAQVAAQASKDLEEPNGAASSGLSSVVPTTANGPPPRGSYGMPSTPAPPPDSAAGADAPKQE